MSGSPRRTQPHSAAAQLRLVTPSTKLVRMPVGRRSAGRRTLPGSRRHTAAAPGRTRPAAPAITGSAAPGGVTRGEWCTAAPEAGPVEAAAALREQRIIMCAPSNGQWIYEVRPRPPPVGRNPRIVDQRTKLYSADTGIRHRRPSRTALPSLAVDAPAGRNQCHRLQMFFDEVAGRLGKEACPPSRDRRAVKRRSAQPSARTPIRK